MPNPARPRTDAHVTTFRTRNDSIEAVSAPVDKVWAAMADADLLAELTPMIDHIEVDGEHWTWCLTGVGALGVEIAPRFTVAMTFDEPHRIAFRHDPPAGATERASNFSCSASIVASTVMTTCAPVSICSRDFSSVSENMTTS
jgi:carbon monoxide dehydrogenase subunit G